MRVLIGLLTLLGAGTVVALSQPGIRCSMFPPNGFVELQPGIYLSQTSSIDAQRFTNMLDEAHARLLEHYPTLQYDAVVYASQNLEQLGACAPNPTGATHFVPWRTTVVIGPEGLNVDVIAHELMHAELVTRIGYLKRVTSMPVWFDEGLAMQVDTRERYLTPKLRIDVTQLGAANEFFVSDDEQLTLHYANAKVTVAAWRANDGQPSNLLHAIATGTDFGASYARTAQADSEL